MTTIDRSRLESEVHEALLSYCRGIDRLEPRLIRRGFHAGARMVDYGPDEMTIEQFANHAVTSLRDRFVSTQHRISNTTIETHLSETGQYALVETYVHAMHVENSETGRRLHTFVGRYIDRFDNRDRGDSLDTWRIAHRTLRCDWTTIEPIPDPMRSTYVPSGRAGSPDPIWN